jgi:hypothetical protein
MLVDGMLCEDIVVTLKDVCIVTSKGVIILMDFFMKLGKDALC